ncbi:MAG TPA: 50S ribosomal protein L9 [Gammaproteobacteria bacterium]|nr:50S ribosomal protein L9 [Gammaproteobacteria bacterium]
MEIILLEKVENLGNLGDRVRVKNGYGRNFLLPQRKAVRATPENIREFEARREELEKAAADALTRARGRTSSLEGLEVTITARTAGEGRLYGSVGPVDVADAIAAAGVEVEKKEVRMPQGPIRQVGEYEVEVHLHTDVDVPVRVVVVGEQ